MAGPLASGRGLPKNGPGHLCVNRGPTGDLLPLSYLGAPTSASGKREPRSSPKGPRDWLAQFYTQPPTPASRHPHTVRRCQDNSPRARGRPVGDFRCVSRDTRATSRKGVLDPFKAGQKTRLFGGKSRPFPALTPHTPKHPAGGSIPPISTHLKPRVSVGSPGFVRVSGAPLWRDASLGACPSACCMA